MGIEKTVLLVIALVSMLAVACGPVAELETPAGYVELEEGKHFSATGATFKAMSADGAVLLARVQDNETEADLSFWANAFERQMTEGSGFELIGTEEVSTLAGRKGRTLQLRATMDEVLYRYELSVFADKDYVYTVEAVAPEEIWGAQESVLRNAVKTLVID